MKLKKALSTLLALVLLLSCMSVTALADGATYTVKSSLTTWDKAGTYVVIDDVTINGTVTITANVVLQLAQGKTLTIIGTNGSDGADSGEEGLNGIDINNGSLTVTGSGTLDVTGGHGGKCTGSGYGGDGGHGILLESGSTLTVNSGTVKVTGGNGGAETSNSSQGYAKEGLYAEYQSVVVNGGTLNVDCGYDGNGRKTQGYAFYNGSLTVNGGAVNLTGAHHGFYSEDGALTINKGSVKITARTALLCKIVMSGGTLTTDGEWYTQLESIISGGFITCNDNFRIQTDSSFLTGGYFSRDMSNTEDYETIDTEYFQCVANADPATKGSYGYIVLPVNHYQLISASSPAGKGSVGFTVGGNAATDAAEEAEVTVTAMPADGYKLDSLTYTPAGGSATAITDGKFSMPDKAVTVNATFSKIQTTGEDIDLDLETDTTNIPESTTIDQYYTKAEASSIVDTHRIGVTWWTDARTTLGHNDLVVQVNNAVKWDPTTLSWVEDEALNGVASVQEGTNKVNFKLSNYSAKAFTCEISYAKNTEDTLANEDANTVTFDSNNGGTLAKVENDINNPGETNSAYLDENGQVDLTKVPTLTITGTVGVDLDGFKNAEATSSAVKYGRFTVTCTAVTE